jgi:hypothetical protein
LLLKTWAPQSGQQLRSSPLPDFAVQWYNFGLPLTSAKSSSGTQKNIAASLHDAFLRPRQRQTATKVGLLLNSHLSRRRCTELRILLSFVASFSRWRGMGAKRLYSCNVVPMRDRGIETSPQKSQLSEYVDRLRLRCYAQRCRTPSLLVDRQTVITSTTIGQV